MRVLWKRASDAFAGAESTAYLGLAATSIWIPSETFARAFRAGSAATAVAATRAKTQRSLATHLRCGSCFRRILEKRPRFALSTPSRLVASTGCAATGCGRHVAQGGIMI